MPPPKWRIRLSAEAERDFVRILMWTRETFGPRQMDAYAATLRAALTALEHGPDPAGSVARDDVLPGLRTLHVARRRRRGRHFVMYRAGVGAIEIVRNLHDAMDLARHLPTETTDGDI